MATHATAQILAKGPLSSALGQWMFLGLGTFVIFTGDNGVSIAAKEIASVAFRLVTGRDAASASSAAFLSREAALSDRLVGRYEFQQGQQQQQPIVIHAANDARGWTAAVIRLGLGAGACWAAYLVFSNFLPERIQEMLPVTRKFFQSAVTSLGEGILRVRDVLSAKIDALGARQDDLRSKLDRTHDGMLGLRDDVGDARLRIDDVAIAISRCESSLDDAAGRQAYMSSGVRLLVRCVGDLLRPSSPAVAAELDRFGRMGAEMMDHDASGASGCGTVSSFPSKEHGRYLDCPSSPNLSEIGSTGSTIADDHCDGNVRYFSSPYPQLRPTAAPVSSNDVMSASPSLKMLRTATARNGSASNVTAVPSYSSPENELPRANYQQKPRLRRSTPSEKNDGTNLMEIDELLRTVRRVTS